VSCENPQTGRGTSGGGRPGSHENQEPCLSNVEADGKCHMKIHKPAQALLGVEGQGSMKIRKPAP